MTNWKTIKEDTAIYHIGGDGQVTRGHFAGLDRDGDSVLMFKEGRTAWSDKDNGVWAFPADECGIKEAMSDKDDQIVSQAMLHEGAENELIKEIFHDL